jgi:hypothetical protein
MGTELMKFGKQVDCAQWICLTCTLQSLPSFQDFAQYLSI